MQLRPEDATNRLLDAETARELHGAATKGGSQVMAGDADDAVGGEALITPYLFLRCSIACKTNKRL